MKIRTGFVSNSSSSSFVAWGIYADNIRIPDKFYLKIFEEDLSDEHPEIKTDEEKVEMVKEYYGGEIFETEDITSRSYPYDNEYMVGITPYTLMKKYSESKIGDIKKLVAEKINETFGSNIKEENIQYFEESWMDG